MLELFDWLQLLDKMISQFQFFTDLASLRSVTKDKYEWDMDGGRNLVPVKGYFSLVSVQNPKNN